MATLMIREPLGGPPPSPPLPAPQAPVAHEPPVLPQLDRVTLRLPPPPAPAGLLPAPPGLTSQDIDQLKAWGHHASGTLLTPPAGHVRDDVAKVRGYVQGLVERLAGDRLRREGIHLVVDLFSPDALNAFMGGHDADRSWEASIRRLNGFGPDGQPMYELGINAGTLRKLKTEEELAFVVAHELSHLFEHHSDPAKNKLEGYSQTWLSSQAHEAVADHEGIKMMVAAGYDPQGALALLNRLFTRAKPEQASTYLASLEAGAEAHHHEGVRLSLAQGEIELLRRTDAAARPTDTLHPLPEWLKLHAASRDGAHEHNLEGLENDIAVLATRYMLQPSPQPWVARGISQIGGAPGDPPELKAMQFKYSPNPSELGEAFRAGFEAIRAADAAPQEKVDAVLRLMLFMHGQFLTVDPPVLDAQTQADVTYMLAKCHEWRADVFLSKLGRELRDDDKREYPYQQFALEVLRNPQYEKIFAPLYQVGPQWRSLVDQLPGMLMIDAKTGRADCLGYVADQVKKLAKPEDKPGLLDAIHQRNVLRFLESHDLTPWVEGTDHWGTFTFYSILDKISDPELQAASPAFFAQLRQVLEPRVQQFAAFRERIALARLGGSDSGDPKQLSNFLQGLFQTEKVAPFAPAFRTKLAPALLAFVRRANHEKGLIYGEFMMGPDPITQAPGVGRMLADMLEDPQTSAEDRREILAFVARNHAAGTSLPKSGERADVVHRLARAAAAQAVPDEVGRRDDAQYGELLSNGIGHALGLPPVALDDASLQRLADRWNAGDFCVKSEKGADGKPTGRFDSVLKAHVARMMDVQTDLEFAQSQDLNRRLSPLTFLGADPKVSREAAARLAFADVGRLLDGVEDAHRRYKLVAGAMQGLPRDKQGLSADAAAYLLDGLLASQDQAPDLDTWYDRAHRILTLNPTAVEARLDSRDRLEAYLKPRLEALPPEQLLGWMAKEYVLDGLHAETTADLAAKLVDPALPPDALAARVAEVDGALKLREKHPEAFDLLRDRLAEAAHLQPGDVEKVFPSGQQSVTESAEVLSGPIRGLSALVALTRERPVAEQIDMIEYLMGRRADMPDYLLDVTSQGDVVAPITEMVRDARTRLQHENVATRVLVANSFLAGPNAFVRQPAGLNQILDYMLRDIRPEHQDLARRLARALLDSQGDTDSLALAYVLGQKGEGPEGKLSEATVLNNLFDAYGVPGIKLKQYLAFTSEFKEFRSAFESAQDNAMPLTYYQAVKLLRDRFDGQWPAGLRVEKILGSGSVNIGIKYFNPQTERSEVVVVARENIETATHYDFLRFKRFLASLTNTPEDMEKFGYLLGLADVIHGSVTLEFDKPRALAMQKQVQPLYHREVHGWNVRTVDAFSQEHMALFMEEANGCTARKLQEKDPAAYRSAMAAMSQVEMDVLLGIDEHGAAHPVPLHANPDFHDGQVLVDPATRTVTLLDFGQAVPITNAERDYGLDLLRVIGKAQGVKAAARLLAHHAPGITAADLAPILARSDRMDVFIHLLSLLNRSGHKVPIATVHWVMAMDRQMALGQKIDVPNEPMVRNLVMVSRFGGGFTQYNHAHLLKERASHAVAAAAARFPILSA